MQITRLYTRPDGQTHFEDIDIELVDLGPIGQISEQWPGSGVIFRETDGDYDLDYHVAPRRQLVVNLEGWVEIGSSTGAHRQFGPGSILLAEDLTGKGHISRAVDGQPRRCLLIPLDAEPGS